MNILTFQTQEALNKAGAGIITALLQTNPNARLGLATGGTPVGIYEELVRDCQAGLVSFQGASSFNLDEYIGLERNHEASYYTFMQKHLLGQVDISPERCHIPDGMAEDLEKECLRYERLLKDSGQIDLQLLGLGHNGHIGFNEPDSALVCGTHVVELREQTREANARFFDKPEQVPTHAITMGVGTILKAKLIVLVVRGKDKAEIVKQALQGPITTECPASLLQTHSHVVVLLDQEAGSLLV
ncbi:glucosamine-6-phosphate deaminase [Paenibacillus sp. UNCCL117]|uniref:glucosamine-6-phosphate deaminase n=1 Tax=unclassified Paenibacillus TaxID=185978 RepID=UPI000891C820|nr:MULTISPECIES: glucosamine-6-phosphate deaminase [unclassified Paenibacillus]SDC06427.1 glucosamine-6-phosphate deaminase [Paenibacillus sp. cl123]SFW37821.1 glucosamine-6-phosphate deaminase [Paenibacillus sp. UNCCL117]